jgi:hypothetical protein
MCAAEKHVTARTDIVSIGDHLANELPEPGQIPLEQRRCWDTRRQQKKKTETQRQRLRAPWRWSYVLGRKENQFAEGLCLLLLEGSTPVFPTRRGGASHTTVAGDDTNEGAGSSGALVSLLGLLWLDFDLELMHRLVENQLLKFVRQSQAAATVRYDNKVQQLSNGKFVSEGMNVRRLVLFLSDIVEPNQNSAFGLVLKPRF